MLVITDGDAILRALLPDALSVIECIPGRPFNRSLDIVQVLQDRLVDHALEKDHRQRFQTCNKPLRHGLMRTGQRDTATTF